ncbi:Retrovirus-related Pol polyprotein, partial [Mucuna pruriens]
MRTIFEGLRKLKLIEVEVVGTRKCNMHPDVEHSMEECNEFKELLLAKLRVERSWQWLILKTMRPLIRGLINLNLIEARIPRQSLGNTIALENQHKTTFTCTFSTFAYTRMPFGLCNAPSTFQRCMFSIFSDLLEECMEVFMDDFTVYADTFEACLGNLSRVLKRCMETNLVLNYEKCHFMVTKGIVLGHLVSNRGIEVDKAKIDVITSLPKPTSVQEVHSFLGHASFYRRFIKNFSKIALPLSKLLQKDVDFVFDEACVEAFEELKVRLTSIPILQAPN